MTAKEQYEQYIKNQKKYSRDFKIAMIKLRLSAPNPIRYELWYALHDCLEKLEVLQQIEDSYWDDVE